MDFVGGELRPGQSNAIVNLGSMLYGRRSANDIADAEVSHRRAVDGGHIEEAIVNNLLSDGMDRRTYQRVIVLVDDAESIDDVGGVLDKLSTRPDLLLVAAGRNDGVRAERVLDILNLTAGDPIVGTTLNDAVLKLAHYGSRPHEPARPNPRSDLEAAFEIHRRELTGFCYRILGSESEAENAVQETMARTWRSIDGFESRSSLRSWLYRIANNVCIDMIRRPQRPARPLEMGPSSDTSETDRPTNSALDRLLQESSPSR